MVKNGTRRLPDQQVLQAYRCRSCTRSFNERIGTPMARLRTVSTVVEYALRSRSEGVGIRATGRVYGKSHATLLRWEDRLARQSEIWCPPVPPGSEITLEGDELDTRVGENLPPRESRGWTLTFLERASRDWVTAQAGLKDETLFTAQTTV